MNRSKTKVLSSVPALSHQMAATLQTVFRYQQSGDLSAAEEALRKLLRKHPKHPVILLQSGNFSWSARRYDDAVRYYQLAVDYCPDYTEAINNLGATLWLLGKQEEAIACYEKVIRLNPDSPEAHYNLAGACYQLGSGAKAIAGFQEAIRLQPNYADAWRCLGNSYYEQGFHDAAVTCYKNVVDLNPCGGAKIRAATVIPLIPESRVHIEEIRTQLNNNLDKLLAEAIRVDDPARENGYTNFALAYHGKNDRLIQEKYAHLYIKACPLLSYSAPHCIQYFPPAGGRRIRIAFASSNFKNHSIGNTSKGIIQRLSRERFEVFVLSPSQPQDETSRLIAQSADHYVVLPADLQSAMHSVAQLKLDILFYQDIGLDPFLFFLAFTRLAPVQCTSFGHPVTTGIPNLDYYISTDYWEPEQGEDNYSEQLIRLKNVASVAYYYKPPLGNELKSRGAFGLSEHDHIYICPQALFKLHPEFDYILEGVLEADPLGKVVLIEGKHPHWTESVRTRYSHSIPDVFERILFLPRQSGDDFINLIAVSDVMLDTIHFNGFNTTLQGFRVGVPVVTLPGRYMRGRHTMCFYRKMDYMDMVARDCDEYIQLVVHLGTDSIYRETVSRQISERVSILWQEEEVIQEFERFFQRTMVAWPKKIN